VNAQGASGCRQGDEREDDESDAVGGARAGVPGEQLADRHSGAQRDGGDGDA
jgi:hypothetical protein